MMNFAKELIDIKTTQLEIITALVVNTVKAKFLFKIGGWELVTDELGDKCMNPHFPMHYRTIHTLLDKLKINTDINIKNKLSNIEQMVNKKIGTTAVKYVIDRKAHFLRIVI
jgi:hypothetical protein